MVEVVKSTFDEKFEEIENAIRHCDFIAIDTEFTGLKLNEETKSSLFDDGAARYAKLRKTMTQVTICQLGLSIVTKDPKKDSQYEAVTYNFYLCPRSFGPVDGGFFCQASAMQFLTSYNFDFNKFIHEGVSFMNDDQETLIRDHIASKAMFTGLERDLDEHLIQKTCSRVAEWLIQGKSPQFIIEKSEIERISLYVCSMELRGRFPDIWTNIDKTTKTIEITRISREERQLKESELIVTQREHEESLVLKMLGFTRLFRVMKQCKKPLLGHNMLLDLLLIYDKFHQPLPVSYTEFKATMHSMFPHVYDTKHIVQSVRRSMEHTGLLHYTSLLDVYHDIKSDAGRDLVIHPPNMIHAESCKWYEDAELPHQAGFDAYMCAFVFLRLCHIQTFKDTKSSEVIPCMFRRYLQNMEGYQNKINMIRGRVNHITLDATDQLSQKPELLYVRSRGFHKLNISQLAKWFSSYGSVDVKSYGKNSALVATTNFRCSKDILQSFRRHNSVYVRKYSVWRHSPMVRVILWTSVAISSGLCLVTLGKSWLKKD